MRRFRVSMMLFVICLLTALSVFVGGATIGAQDDKKQSLEQRIERLEKLVEQLIERGGSGDASSRPAPPVRNELARAQIDRVMELQLELAALRHRFGNDHPKVELIKQQLATINKLLYTNRGVTAESARARLTRDLEEMQAEFAIKQEELKVLQAGIREIKRQIAELEARETGAQP